ncbi:MAG: hypothetical protein HUJ30_04775 [Gammaproteobacteria bacterium]|nr:hypothetical protein [Gammaproteobacteria bacterium]
MKKTMLSLAVASAMVMSAGSAAAAEGAANVALVSDYVFRGVTQSDGGASLQGGYDYDMGNGVALGIWGATGVNFGVEEIEYDIYASYSGEAGDMGYSIGFTNYMYTESDAIGEVALGLSFGSVSIGYYSASSIDYTYYELGYDMSAGGMDVNFHYGNDGASADMAVGLSKDMGGYSLGLTATTHDTADSTAALSVSKEF